MLAFHNTARPAEDVGDGPVRRNTGRRGGNDARAVENITTLYRQETLRSRSSSGTSGSPRRSRRTRTSWAIGSPTISGPARALGPSRSGSTTPSRGSPTSVLDDCDVLIWWGHVRQAEVTPETGGKDRRADQGGHALPDRPALGPLVDAVRRGDERAEPGSTSAGRARPPARGQGRGHGDAAAQPLHAAQSRRPAHALTLERPEVPRRIDQGRRSSCPTAASRPTGTDGKPSQVRVLKPDHPIAAGSPPASRSPRPRCTTSRSTSPSPTR